MTDQRPTTPRRPVPAPKAPSGGVLGRFVLPVGIFVLFAVVLQFLVRTGTEPRPDATVALGSLADPGDVYDPVKAGERLPRGFRQLLRRDAILPIYDPTFVKASQTTWSGDTLVLGIELEGDARAYPIRFLNRREMVIDSIAGIPVLVTW